MPSTNFSLFFPLLLPLFSVSIIYFLSFNIRFPSSFGLHLKVISSSLLFTVKLLHCMSPFCSPHSSPYLYFESLCHFFPLRVSHPYNNFHTHSTSPISFSFPISIVANDSPFLLLFIFLFTTSSHISLSPPLSVCIHCYFNITAQYFIKMSACPNPITRD